MRSHKLLGFALALGAACAADSAPDELDGELDNEEAGKLDGDAAFTYWQVDVSSAGFAVSRPNRTSTECGDGTRGESCTVPALDLAGTAMPASVAKSYEDRLRAGESLLLRGEIAARPYVVLSKLAGPAIAGGDLVPALPSNAPSIHVGDENGPDCLYARLFVKDVDVVDADITISKTATGALAFHGRFGGVSIPSTSEHAVSCVNGTAPVTFKATTLTADGNLTVAADGAISFTNMTYAFTGVSRDSALPQPIYDMLFSNEAAVGAIVTSSVALALAPLARSTKNARALAVTEVWVPGSTAASDLTGVFVLATQDGSAIRERRINSTRSAQIDELDLEDSGADAAGLARGAAGLASGHGVLLVGDRYYSGGKQGRRANQFWTKAPVPLH
jgi:hypothetical protein